MGAGSPVGAATGVDLSSVRRAEPRLSWEKVQICAAEVRLFARFCPRVKVVLYRARQERGLIVGLSGKRGAQGYSARVLPFTVYLRCIGHAPKATPVGVDRSALGATGASKLASFLTQYRESFDGVTKLVNTRTFVRVTQSNTLIQKV